MLAILSGSGPSVGDLARQLARLERPSKTPERVRTEPHALGVTGDADDALPASACMRPTL